MIQNLISLGVLDLELLESKNMQHFGWERLKFFGQKTKGGVTIR